MPLCSSSKTQAFEMIKRLLLIPQIDLISLRMTKGVTQCATVNSIANNHQGKGRNQ